MEKARMLGMKQAVVGGTEGGRSPTGVPPTTAAARRALAATQRWFFQESLPAPVSRFIHEGKKPAGHWSSIQANCMSSILLNTSEILEEP
mgnify:CR=1 FL=1